jgi:hypothetical protein
MEMKQSKPAPKPRFNYAFASLEIVVEKTDLPLPRKIQLNRFVWQRITTLAS